MGKICKFEKENCITEEDNACFSPTNNRFYGDPNFIPGFFLK